MAQEKRTANWYRGRELIVNWHRRREHSGTKPDQAMEMLPCSVAGCDYMANKVADITVDIQILNLCTFPDGPPSCCAGFSPMQTYLQSGAEITTRNSLSSIEHKWMFFLDKWEDNK